jgi:hypothetical protein
MAGGLGTALKAMGRDAVVEGCAKNDSNGKQARNRVRLNFDSNKPSYCIISIAHDVLCCQLRAS